MNYLLIISFLCSVVGCGKKTMSNNNNGQPVVKSYSYLVLGDSYTIGQGIAAPGSYPIQTKNFLRAAGKIISQVDIIAATGWTTSDLMNAINQRNPSPNYNVVSLLIGVNDQYSRRDTTGYRAGFTVLLQKAIYLAGNHPERVFVISIPDYSATPFAANSDTVMIRQQIDQFNAINKKVSSRYFVKYLDITPSSREARNDLTLVASDGLHPWKKEYKKWSERLTGMMKLV